MTKRRVRGIVTTAFTKRPVSMKYRGMFELLNRKENDLAKQAWAKDIDAATNSYYAQPYELNYGSAMGRWTLAEGMAEWKRKHGQRVAGGGVEE